MAVALALARAGLCAAQQSTVDDLGPGVFLIAPRDAADPRFANSVVLLLRHDETGTLGVIINRPAKISISRVFEGSKSARQLGDPAYSGGPVAGNSVLALYRSSQKVENALRVLDGVYLIASKTVLDRILDTKPTAGNFRVYLGYAGWAPGQLEREMELKAWRLLPGDEESVFDPNPSAVWPRLINRTEVRYAGLFWFDRQAAWQTSGAR